MIERPNIKDFFDKETTLTTIKNMLLENKELYNYINALDNYIDELEDQINKNNNQTIQLTNKQNFVAVFRMCHLITPEEWEVRTETKLCNGDTTIKEIFDWYKRKMSEAKFHCEIIEAE